jgi:hypothetical protein
MYNYYNPGGNSGASLSGAYSFDQTFTSITANPSSGWDLADLLLGFPRGVKSTTKTTPIVRTSTALLSSFRMISK